MTSIGKKLAVGIVGFGKIAKDQHLSALEQSPDFFLHSIADPSERESSIESYRNVETMLAAADAPSAVAICTPPQVRCDIARHALRRGKHVLLEKPPGATVSEVENLELLAKDSGLTLFSAWHSRFAPAVSAARDWLATRTLRRAHIDWREDVRIWHPGQAWIWQRGGFGVFDPGINAISIATRILPTPLFVRDALLRIPENCETPVSAELAFSDMDGVSITASFDWLQRGQKTWDMEVETDDGHLLLTEGGGRLVIDGNQVRLGPKAEYPALYKHFAELITTGRSDVDLTPLRLVADALVSGRREAVEPFFERPAD